MKIIFKNTKTIDYINNFYMNCILTVKPIIYAMIMNLQKVRHKTRKEKGEIY